MLPCLWIKLKGLHLCFLGIWSGFVLPLSWIHKVLHYRGCGFQKVFITVFVDAIGFTSPCLWILCGFVLHLCCGFRRFCVADFVELIRFCIN